MCACVPHACALQVCVHVALLHLPPACKQPRRPPPLAATSWRPANTLTAYGSSAAERHTTCVRRPLCCLVVLGRRRGCIRLCGRAGAAPCVAAGAGLALPPTPPPAAAPTRCCSSIMRAPVCLCVRACVDPRSSTSKLNDQYGSLLLPPLGVDLGARALGLAGGD